jgi:hypothetical protein
MFAVTVLKIKKMQPIEKQQAQPKPENRALIVFKPDFVKDTNSGLQRVRFYSDSPAHLALIVALLEPSIQSIHVTFATEYARKLEGIQELKDWLQSLPNFGDKNEFSYFTKQP